MKWRFILLALALALTLAAALVPLMVAAAPSASVTVTFWWIEPGGQPHAPTNFDAFYVADGEHGITWTKGTYAVNTTVRGAYGRYPTSRTDGYEVYYGNGTSAQGWTAFLGTVYYRAWSQNTTGGWSADYASDYVENEQMSELVTVLDELKDVLPVFGSLAVLIFFSVLCFWHGNTVLFMLTAGTAIFVGFAWYDLLNKPIGMAVGLLMLGYAIFCLYMGYRYIPRGTAYDEYDEDED